MLQPPEAPPANPQPAAPQAPEAEAPVLQPVEPEAPVAEAPAPQPGSPAAGTLTAETPAAESPAPLPRYEFGETNAQNIGHSSAESRERLAQPEQVPLTKSPSLSRSGE